MSFSLKTILFKVLKFETQPFFIGTQFLNFFPQDQIFKMKITLMMIVTVLSLSLAQAQTSMLGKGGVIQINTDRNIVIVRDSLLVTFVYDMNAIEYMWNEYIENCESLISKIGHSKCVEKVLNDSRESRFKIKGFLRSHKSSKRERRQVFLGILGGLTSLAT